MKLLYGWLLDSQSEFESTPGHPSSGVNVQIFEHLETQKYDSIEPYFSASGENALFLVHFQDMLASSR